MIRGILRRAVEYSQRDFIEKLIKTRQDAYEANVSFWVLQLQNRIMVLEAEAFSKKNSTHKKLSRNKTKVLAQHKSRKAKSDDAIAGEISKLFKLK